MSYYSHVEPTDLTIRILQEIREEIRGSRADQRSQADRFDAFARETAQRFEVIETTLRDLAQQLVMLSHAVKVAIEVKRTVESRLDEHERRLGELEKRQPES